MRIVSPIFPGDAILGAPGGVLQAGGQRQFSRVWATVPLGHNGGSVVQAGSGVSGGGTGWYWVCRWSRTVIRGVVMEH